MNTDSEKDLQYWTSTRTGETRIGLAYGDVANTILASNPDLLDFVEIPYEQIVHMPECRSVQTEVPAVLHCSSLSLAGFVPPSAETLQGVVNEAERMQTPWIGEHLAFLSADCMVADIDAHATPTNLTYTVCPQLSESALQRIVANLEVLQPKLGRPLIVENSPLYFDLPGSEMSMAEFLREVADRTSVGLLLDLSHFVITSINTKKDPMNELCQLPLDRVVEVHMSGYSEQMGRAWDDHSSPAQSLQFELLSKILSVNRPQAVTFEYNWGPDFPLELTVEHLSRVQKMLN